MQIRLRTSIAALLILLFNSCGKDDITNTPGGYVDTYIYLSDPSAFNLNTIGGWMYYNGGLKGLIVYRRSQEEFAAYSRECTYDPNESCALLEMETSATSAIDSCCGSRFSIFDGSVLKGPASVPMYQYHVTFDGNQIHIYS